MSKIALFKALEAELAAQLRQLDALKNNEKLTREIEFEQKLRNLMASYDVSLCDVITILDPQLGSRRATPAAPLLRRQRQAKIYTNPETGEVVETKSGNHKMLKAWKKKHGAEEVEGWLK